MDESWAQPILQWILTPALITAALVGLAQLYDPQTRWSRRLKSDLTITGGLPDGPEKSAWQDSIDWQAMRLREYREAFVGKTLFWRWAGLAFIAVPLILLVLFPPINEPGDRFPFGPTDYMMMGMGLFTSGIYAVSLASGRDFLGRSPRDIILIRRGKRFKSRWRKLKSLDKERARRAESEPNYKQKGSALGFSTQVDVFGPWMRDRDLRAFVETAGFVAPDIAGRYLASARGRGVELPAWPDLNERPSSLPRR